MKCKACNREMAAQDWNHRWVCTRCGRTKPYAEPMTNADRIRSLSDKELAALLAHEIPHGDCSGCGLECSVSFDDEIQDCCQNAFYKWLKQPYGGADHE